jgi:hypothetical protein
MKITIVNKTQFMETPHKFDIRKLYNKEVVQAKHIILSIKTSNNF